MKRRIEKLEGRAEAKRYLPIILINEGEPLPDNIGPNTVVIVDTISEEDIPERGNHD